MEPHEIANVQDQVAQLAGRHKNGAGWFYWIAGLSLVNSIAQLMQAEWSFVIGLGVTQIVDFLALQVAAQAGASAAIVAKVIAIAVDVLVAGIFALFGYLAASGRKWGYVLGMILYGLDGLLFLLAGDLFSLAFHGLALFFILQGLVAYGRMEKLAASIGAPPPVPAA